VAAGRTSQNKTVLHGKAVSKARVVWISRLNTLKDVEFGGEATHNTSGRMCVQNFDSDVCFMWCVRVTVSKKLVNGIERIMD
jgi:hypothetical protein